MTDIHLNIIVKGRVQGVGFRFSTVRKARSLGINGFVRNRSDGTVYIEAEGSKSQLDKLVSWCYAGPTYAWVEDVMTENDEFKNFSGFDARI